MVPKGGGVACLRRIQCLLNQPSLLLAAVLSIVVVNMASLHLSMEVVSSPHPAGTVHRQHYSNNDREPHHHQEHPPAAAPRNWFSSVMNVPLLSAFSIFQSPPSTTTTTINAEQFRPDDNYDWSRSTEYNYRSHKREHVGRFRSLRQKLDHSYHQYYTTERQAMQDAILEEQVLRKGTTIVDATTGQECSLPAEPWIIFTAGVYGAGKTHTIKKLDERGQFPLGSFVAVDPDEIRRHLPEFPTYIEKSPEKAGELTRKEVGMMAEIVTNYALERGMNVLVDGSLKDASWYENYFRSLRQKYPKLKIGIIHVTAPTDAILERVHERAKTTGRVVPMEALQRSIREVPMAVERLRSSVDYFLEIDNPPDTASTTSDEVTRPAFLSVSLGNFPSTPTADVEKKLQLKCPNR